VPDSWPVEPSVWASNAPQLASLMATLVLETTGAQEYTLEAGSAKTRLAGAYGDDAAAEIAAAISWK